MESKRVNILNILIDNMSMSDLLEKLKTGGVVFTPNVDHLVKLQNDSEFYRVYQEADYRVCDSQMIMFASRFLGKPLREKISGSDLFPAFYQRYGNDPSVKIFILGGQTGVAEQASRNINAKVGREIVVGNYCPDFGFENDPLECQKIIEIINNSGANVLAVGVGAPKQEKWISQYKSRLHSIQTFFAIGATIDFESGMVQRAPEWMSSSGLEWLYRLILEPGRLWKRYLVEDVYFFVLIFRQKFNLDRKKDISKKESLFETR